MSEEKSSGCGCGAIILLWFIVFAFLRLCGFTEVSWWYSIAPIWWPVLMLVKLVGIVIVAVVAVVCVVGVVSYIVARRTPSVRQVHSEEVSGGKVIDVEYEEVDGK